QAGEKRQPRAEHDAAQEVAAQLVGPQRVSGEARRLEARRDVALARVAGADPRRQQRARAHRRHQHHAGDQPGRARRPAHPRHRPGQAEPCNRMRGSSTAYRRSTRTLTDTTKIAITTTAACTTGKSRLLMASITSRPRPGQLNTVTTMMAPPRRYPMSSPSTVTMDSEAFLSACPRVTRAGAIPLACAVRT